MIFLMVCIHLMMNAPNFCYKCPVPSFINYYTKLYFSYFIK